MRRPILLVLFFLAALALIPLAMLLPKAQTQTVTFLSSADDSPFLHLLKEQWAGSLPGTQVDLLPEKTAEQRWQAGEGVAWLHFPANFFEATAAGREREALRLTLRPHSLEAAGLEHFFTGLGEALEEGQSAMFAAYDLEGGAAAEGATARLNDRALRLITALLRRAEFLAGEQTAEAALLARLWLLALLLLEAVLGVYFWDERGRWQDLGLAARWQAEGSWARAGWRQLLMQSVLVLGGTGLLLIPLFVWPQLWPRWLALSSGQRGLAALCLLALALILAWLCRALLLVFSAAMQGRRRLLLVALTLFLVILLSSSCLMPLALWPPALRRVLQILPWTVFLEACLAVLGRGILPAWPLGLAGLAVFLLGAFLQNRMNWSSRESSQIRFRVDDRLPGIGNLEFRALGRSGGILLLAAILPLVPLAWQPERWQREEQKPLAYEDEAALAAVLPSLGLNKEEALALPGNSDWEGLAASGRYRAILTWKRSSPESELRIRDLRLWAEGREAQIISSRLAEAAWEEDLRRDLQDIPAWEQRQAERRSGQDHWRFEVSGSTAGERLPILPPLGLEIFGLSVFLILASQVDGEMELSQRLRSQGRQLWYRQIVRWILLLALATLQIVLFFLALRFLRPDFQWTGSVAGILLLYAGVSLVFLLLHQTRHRMDLGRVLFIGLLLQIWGGVILPLPTAAKGLRALSLSGAFLAWAEDPARPAWLSLFCSMVLLGLVTMGKEAKHASY